MLADGGTAADAAVAAALASCVAETVMTGLLGGGHAIYLDARTGAARNLDCFCAVPGLGEPHREAELVHLDVPFGEELVHYAVGPASCAVPGVPAGLHALWREHGRLPWRRLVEPALKLAREGVPLPPAHAACLEMLAPVFTLREGARMYAPGGTLLRAGERLEQPGLAPALEALADEGAASVYSGHDRRVAARALATSAAACSPVPTSTRTRRRGASRSRPPGSACASSRAAGSRASPARSPACRACAACRRPSACSALVGALDGAAGRRRTRRISSRSTPRAARAS